MAKTASPNTTVWPLELAYETKANFDFFRGIPIVPVREQRLPAAEQYGPYTSETAKAVGNVMGVSPRMVDHTIGKVTGLLGKTAVSGIDMVLQTAGLADETPKAARSITSMPIVGDFVAEVRAGGSVSIERFYADLGKAETIRASERGPKNELEQRYDDSLTALRRVSSTLSDLRSIERLVHKARTWEDLKAYAPSGTKLSDPVTPEEKQRALEFLQLSQINAVRTAYGKEPISW